LPYLTETGRECGETVALAAIDGLRITHLTAIPGHHVLRSEGEPVNRFNAHATALGKVLLAALSSEDRDRLVTQAGLARHTAHTICSFRQLETELARVREQGYAVDLEESEIGLCCVSAPIHNHMGAVCAAVALSVPRARFGDERRPVLIDLAKATARRISIRLGHEPWSFRSGQPRSAIGTAE
jgi:DNA-binding IclR family transcriptional regulator